MRRPRASNIAAAQLMTALPLTMDDRLTRVEPGPDAELTPDAAAAVDEWIEGWLAAERLEREGIARPGPMLLHGPPGTGKTTVTRAIARRFASARATYVIDAMRVVGSHLGETARDVFGAADSARGVGAILVLEEVDALASRRSYSSGGEVENARATTTVMRVLEQSGPIVLTSNRLDVLDPAVVRRCEYVVEMPEPSPAARRAIVAAELGADPGELPADLALTRIVPLARRARRRAFLDQRPPASALRALLGLDEPPLAIVIHCPSCHVQHVDEGEWMERPHHAHLCTSCGHTWQPCSRPTVGVRAL